MGFSIGRTNNPDTGKRNHFRYSMGVKGLCLLLAGMILLAFPGCGLAQDTGLLRRIKP